MRPQMLIRRPPRSVVEYWPTVGPRRGAAHEAFDPSLRERWPRASAAKLLLGQQAVLHREQARPRAASRRRSSRRCARRGWRPSWARSRAARRSLVRRARARAASAPRPRAASARRDPRGGAPTRWPAAPRTASTTSASRRPALHLRAQLRGRLLGLSAPAVGPRLAHRLIGIGGAEDPRRAARSRGPVSPRG